MKCPMCQMEIKEEEKEEHGRMHRGGKKHEHKHEDHEHDHDE